MAWVNSRGKKQKGSNFDPKQAEEMPATAVAAGLDLLVA